MITYYVNGSISKQSEAEWFFGKAFVTDLTEAARLMHKHEGGSVFKFWQDGTGFLAIEIK